MDSVKKNIWLFYLSEMIFGTFFQQAIWIVYQSKFLTFEQISFFASFAVLVEFIMQMPTGAFADIVGRKLSLALAHLLTAMPMFLIAFWPVPEIMWIYSILWGIGRAFSSGPDAAILYDSLKSVGRENEYAVVNSKGTMSFQFSMAVSVLLGGYIYLYDPKLTYIVSGALSLLGIVVSMMFDDNALRSSFNLKNFISTNWQGVKEIFKDRVITRLSLLYILMTGIASPNQKFFIQPYMVEIGLGDIERSWVAMIVKIVITILAVWLVTKRNILSRPFSILIIPVLMVTTLLAAPWTTYPFVYLIILGVAFTGGNIGMFLMPKLNQQFASSIRSTAISAEKMLATLVYSITTYASGSVVVNSSVANFFYYEGIVTLILILPLAAAVYNSERYGNK